MRVFSCAITWPGADPWCDALAAGCWYGAWAVAPSGPSGPSIETCKLTRNLIDKPIDRPAGPARPGPLFPEARTCAVVLLLVGAVTAIVFAGPPFLDLDVASWFRDLWAEPGVRRFEGAIAVMRRIGPLVVAAAVLPAGVTLAMRMFWPRRRAPMSSRAALFVALSLALGPGLLVNAVLKETWSRPRPGMVTEFGGDHAFMPWWDPRGSCRSNCSFVSGETSSAVWMTAPALLAPPAWRGIALGAAALYALAFAFIRLLMGGHFLSDVIFAAVFTGLVIWAVHGMLFRWRATRIGDAALDARLEALGRKATRAFAALRQSRTGS